MSSGNLPPASRSSFGTETAEEAGGRERWNSRVGFYLAAIGSAVGFGNGKKHLKKNNHVLYASSLTHDRLLLVRSV